MVTLFPSAGTRLCKYLFINSRQAFQNPPRHSLLRTTTYWHPAIPTLARRRRPHLPASNYSISPFLLLQSQRRFAARGRVRPSAGRAQPFLDPTSTSFLLHVAIMSSRKLGGGRILGSGKGLAPPTPPSAPRVGSPLAPSESTVSMASSSLSPPPSAGLPPLGQDIGVSITVGVPGKGGPVDSAGLVCPICNEEMVSLDCYCNNRVANDPFR